MEHDLDARTGELMTIPLSLLVPSKRNVRRTGSGEVTELKASIEAQGMLQNLIVTPAASAKRRRVERYEVVGGMRRLKALQELAAEGKLDADEPILCRVKPTHEAAVASLTENVVRQAMHPADEFEAFQALVREGRTVEEVAALFGISALTVRRRLRLANLHPDLLSLHRADGIRLDQLIALAVTDDVQAQLRVWQQAPDWRRDPAQLRQALLADEIDASTDPLAQFVGLARYEAAGGRLRRDLFSDDECGYLLDSEVLQGLAESALQAATEEVRGEGWAWVQVRPHLSPADRYDFGRCRPAKRAMNKDEQCAYEAMTDELQRLEAQWACDETDEDAASAEERDRRIEDLRDDLDRLEASLDGFSVEAMAEAGAVVCVDHAGRLQVHRGLIHRQARQATTRHAAGASDSASGDVSSGGAEQGGGKPIHSPALTVELTRQLTLATRATLLDRPAVALLALLHCLVQKLVYRDYGPCQSAVCLVPHAPDVHMRGEPGVPFRAETVLEEAQTYWGDRLPGDRAALLPWLMALSDSDRMDLLALCVALLVNGVCDSERPTPLQPLAEILDIDMADWWQPTGADYFSRIKKDAIVQALREGAGEEAAARGKGLPKSELARLAEEALRDRRWVPSLLRLEAKAMK